MDALIYVGIITAIIILFLRCSCYRRNGVVSVFNAGIINQGSLVLRSTDTTGQPVEWIARRNLRITADGNLAPFQLWPSATITLSTLPDTRIDAVDVGSSLTVNGSLRGYKDLDAGSSISVTGDAKIHGGMDAGSSIIVGSRLRARGSLDAGSSIHINGDAAFREADAGSRITIHGRRVDSFSSSISSYASEDSSSSGSEDGF